MSGELNACKRGCLTDGNETKKRKVEENENEAELKAEDSSSKLDVDAKVNQPEQQGRDRVRRKKVVLLLTYSGWGYLGMQRNPGAKTIEDDLLQAMFKADIINEECLKQPQQMLFQRAARTDKGVSAVRQVVSLKLPEDAQIELINKHLPDQIRVVCMKRTTKGFNAKTTCDARTYSYLTPTYAFTPGGEEPDSSFRISDEIIANINNILKVFVGTHNFHNFTSKRGFADASSNRFMISFTCGKPFIKDECEYVVLTVKGQSFMQHHIRKMIGLTIAIARGYTTIDTINRAFKSEPLDLPKAPGLGLMLEEVHYDWYNKQYGKDGVHEALEWSAQEEFIQSFKDKHIISTIVKTETKEESMLTWMKTLSGHSYSRREDRPPTSVKISEVSKKTDDDKTQCTEQVNADLQPENVSENCVKTENVISVEKECVKEEQDANENVETGAVVCEKQEIKPETKDCPDSAADTLKENVVES